MKKIFKYIAALAASVMAFGCYPEVLEVDKSKLPQASDLVYNVDVEEETNLVTFTVDNKDVTPVWFFGEEIIAGKANGGRTYKGHSISVVFNERGDHFVELKAYNSHGLSEGSVPVTFTTTSYIPYNKGLAGWDPAEDGNLWTTANKSKLFHYYAPGWTQISEGPGVEVNGDDYTLSFPQATTDQWQAQFAFTEIGVATAAGKAYDFQVVLNPNVDLKGVTVKLTDAADDGNFYVEDRVDLKAGKDYAYQANFDGRDIADLDVFFDFGGNPENTVVEIKQIILCEHKDHQVAAPKEDPAAATMWDASIEANMWPPVNPTMGFWFSPPGWGGMDTPAGTFTDNGDGTYTIVMPEGMGGDQWMGQVHFESTGLSTTADKKYDFQMVLVSSADHPGVTIKLSKAGDDNTFYCADRHALKAGETFVYQLSNVAGIDIPDIKLSIDVAGGTAGETLVVSDIILCEHQAAHAVAWSSAGEENMWLNAAPTMGFWFSPTGWGGMETPEGTFVDNGDGTYVVTMPEGMGSDQWMGQVHFENTGLSTSASKKYDFQVVLVSSADHPGITIKLSKQGDDNTFYCADRHVVPANTRFVYQLPAMDGIDIDNIKFSLDFAGGVAGSTVTVSDIVLREAE